MGRKCEVFTCSNNESKRKGASFIKFPRNPAICKQWVVFCGSRELLRSYEEHGDQAVTNRKICSDHFAEEDFRIRGRPDRGLRFGIVPRFVGTSWSKPPSVVRVATSQKKSYHPVKDKSSSNETTSEQTINEVQESVVVKQEPQASEDNEVLYFEVTVKEEAFEPENPVVKEEFIIEEIPEEASHGLVQETVVKEELIIEDIPEEPSYCLEQETMVKEELIIDDIQAKQCKRAKAEV